MNDNINIPDSTITTNLTFRQLVLMNMQQLTNFPYIEKDFDALTDYELLCLVVKYLNDVIANQNEQNDSITRMYNSFLALQDYVNNTKDELENAFNDLNDYVRDYFANLDVQDEINNKLDEMVEDGTFLNLIKDYLPYITPELFNAIGDGETDDTTALQNAIDYCIENNKMLCSKKDKTYLVTDKIEINAPIYIDFNFATIKGNNLDTVLEVSYNEPNELNYSISNLIIDGNKNCDICLNVPECRRTIFEKIKVKNFNQYGFYMGSSNKTVGGSKIVNCQATNIDNLISGPIVLGINTPDLEVDGLDWSNVWGGIEKNDAGGNIFNNIHGFVANNLDTLYPNSYFFKVKASAVCLINNAYPDTQQYGFIVDSESVNTNPRLRINGLQTTMARSLLTEYLNSLYPAYLFYFNNSNQSKRITISNGNCLGSLYNDTNNVVQRFCNTTHYIKMNNVFMVGYEQNLNGVNFTSTAISSSTHYTNAEMKIQTSGDTTFISFKGNYNPSVSGKLGRQFNDSNINEIGRILISNLTSNQELFGKAYYGTLNDQNQLLVKGELVVRVSPVTSEKNSFPSVQSIYVTASPSDYTNNTEICDASNNTNYSIVGSIILPANNM